MLWKEPKSLEESFKIAERMELYARKVKPEGKDGLESELKDLVICSSFIVTLNQDCYKLTVIILKTSQATCVFLLLILYLAYRPVCKMVLGGFLTSAELLGP